MVFSSLIMSRINVESAADQRTSKTLISMRSAVPVIHIFITGLYHQDGFLTCSVEKKRRDLSSLPLLKNVDCGYMLVSHERGGSNGYPQSMPLYKTSKHRWREHFKTPRRSSHNRCFSIKMKSIHVDLLSSVNLSQFTI